MSGTGLGVFEIGFGLLWFFYAYGPLVVCVVVALGCAESYGVKLPVAAGMALLFGAAAVGLTTTLDRVLVTAAGVLGIGGWYSYSELPDSPFVFFGGPIILIELIILFIGAPLATWWWCWRNGLGRNLPPSSRDFDPRR